MHRKTHPYEKFRDSTYRDVNYQKVEYQNKDLIGEQSLMVNVELDLKNVPAEIIERLLGLLK